MQKLSQKIIQKKFPRVKGGLLGGAPGLEPASVNLFLQEIVDDVKELERRNDELEARVNTKGPESRTERTPEKLSNDIPKDLVEASEELKRNIRKVENMESFYHSLILRGGSEIEAMKEEARQEATRILEEAEAKAQNLIHEANVNVESKSKELAKMFEHSEDVRRKLQSIVKFIESAV